MLQHFSHDNGIKLFRQFTGKKIPERYFIIFERAEEPAFKNGLCHFYASRTNVNHGKKIIGSFFLCRHKIISMSRSDLEIMPMLIPWNPAKEPPFHRNVLRP